jgi:hypothetical protein
VLPGQHDLEGVLIQSCLQVLDRPLQFRADAFPLPRQLGADLRLLELGVEGAQRLDLFRQSGATLEERLGPGRIGPEAGIGRPALDVSELAGAGLEIKDAPGAR